ncbi:large ribosomal subunit protein mL66-like [Haliotis cracherodii]|uniref:large ribosomal subunit protein mL66-like n=1 Tax=Haliotis cracherodii TaxID=6455 RepID=UPI0039E9A592
MLWGSVLTCVLRSSRQATVNGSPAAAMCRLFTTTNNSQLKEVRQTQTENATVIEGVKIPSSRTDYLLPGNMEVKCPLCRVHTDLKYTDVLILSQFLRPDGCLLPRRVTGVCKKQQVSLEKLVHQAQRAGLLPTFRPDLPSGKPRTHLRSQFKWKQYKIYYLED